MYYGDSATEVEILRDPSGKTNGNKEWSSQTETTDPGCLCYLGIFYPVLEEKLKRPIPVQRPNNIHNMF